MSASSPAYQETTSAAALTSGFNEASQAPDRLAYTMDEFCRAATIGHWLAYTEIAEGRLKVVRVGRRTLVPVDAAKAWLAGLPKGVAGEPAAPRRARLARQRVDEPRRTDCDELTPSGHSRTSESDAPGSKGARVRTKKPPIRPSRDASASS